MAKKKSAIEEFIALPDAEKERIVRQYDAEFVADRAKPLSPEMRRLWNRAKKRGRPRRGAGSKRVLITIEAGLLAKADAFARKTNRTRSSLIAEGLHAILSPE